MPDDLHNPSEERIERLGKYEILGHIATGGMGIVYKARDVALDRLVALKTLPRNLAKQTTTLVRFGREARAAARLKHENIVAIFDVGEDQGTHFIALEFIEGIDLQDHITHQGKLDPEEARQIMIQAARALVHAHEHGIVHRDIKPSNFLLVRRDNRLLVKLTDFGLAMRHENDAEYRITRDKTTVGTVDYMSPEQARDSRSADIRSDIYSLGCTSFHMLAGVAPFARGSLPERILHHMQTPAPDVRRLNKNVPAYLAAILNRMLAKKPEDRYQTPADLLADLENPEQVPLPDKDDKPDRDKARKAKPEATPAVEAAPPEAAVQEIKPSKPARPKKLAESRTLKEDEDREAHSDRTGEPRKRSKKKKAGTPVWMFAAGGTVAVLALVLIGVVVFGHRPPPIEKKPVDPVDEPPPIVWTPPKVEAPPPIDTAPKKMTVVPRPLPFMDLAPEKADRAALLKEYSGPFTAFPAAPAKAVPLQVSRLATPGPTSFRTLDEASGALAQTADSEFTVVEIADDGPHFLPALPALTQRSLVIRGAAGHRPLLVWDLPRKVVEGKAPGIFFALARGKLILENLDFVMQAPAEAPPCIVFDLPGSDFHARNCTFSIAGKSPAGVALVRRIEAGGADHATKTWLQHTFVRGSEMTLLDLQGASADVMLEDSLVAGHQPPLLRVRGRLEDALEFHSVRSTLVCGQNFLHWQPLEAADNSPALRVWLLDSVVSRGDKTTPRGDMLHLADGANPSRMRWRAANTVYAGWKQLQTSQGKSIAGGDLEGWRRQWVTSEGDRTVADTWPAQALSGLEELPALAFLPGQAQVAFASATGPGAIGCTIGWLPPAPPRGWRERLFEPRSAPSLPPPDTDPPLIATATDGLYHGERLDVTGRDFGAYLNAILQKQKPAPRVVIHLTGKGVCASTPVRLRGIQHLVLYAEPSKDLKDPFTLEFNFANAGNPSGAIEMIGGNLELIGLRLRLGEFTALPALVHVEEGDLTITRCRLQGPLSKANDAFQCPIQIRNVGTRPATLLLRDSVLISNNHLAHLQGSVQIRARNNLGVSLGDGIVFEIDRVTAPLTHALEHNTLAVRHAHLTLRAGLEAHSAAPIALHAERNAFLTPFPDSADRRALLRADEKWLTRARWSWHGRYNVYDARLPAYLAAAGKPMLNQSMLDWQRLNGQAGEVDGLAWEPRPPAKAPTLDGPSPAALLNQLDRLALPSSLRTQPGQPPPGADLVSLGFPKKKN